MGPVTHQTIQLSKGKHASPAEGACVMELASMLAGEPFSDHPRSVCPVIAALLRRYNDTLDDWRRQCLYAYASRAVGSRGSARLERARTEHLRRWISERTPPRRYRWFLPAHLLRGPASSAEQLAERAVHKLPRHDPRMHLMVLELVDELLALDPREAAATPPLTTTRPARGREPSCPAPAAK